MRPWIGCSVAVLLACASCSGSRGSPAATGAPRDTASPTGSPAATGPAGAATHDLAGLPAITDPVDVLAKLVGLSTTNADPQLVDLAAKVRDQAGTTMSLPATPAYSGLIRRRVNAADFLLLDLFITGTVLPSQRGADALASMAERVGHTYGLDAPDGPETAEEKDDAPFQTANAAGSMSGAFSTNIRVDAQHSLVKVDLSRTMQGALTKDSTTTPLSADVHNIESIDFCPDAAGVVPAAWSPT